MRQIDDYVYEKLHINKNFKIDTLIDHKKAIENVIMTVMDNFGSYRVDDDYTFEITKDKITINCPTVFTRTDLRYIANQCISFIKRFFNGHYSYDTSKDLKYTYIFISIEYEELG